MTEMKENNIGHSQVYNTYIKYKIREEHPDKEYCHYINDRITVARVLGEHISKRHQQQGGWYPLINEQRKGGFYIYVYI